MDYIWRFHNGNVVLVFYYKKRRTRSLFSPALKQLNFLWKTEFATLFQLERWQLITFTLRIVADSILQVLLNQLSKRSSLLSLFQKGNAHIEPKFQE